MRLGRYYLGRIVKFGRLTNEMIVRAILNPSIIRSAKYEWTITDALDGRDESPSFVYGELSKFLPLGDVTVVDTAEKAKVERPTENLHVASAPFVYLPEFSGIAYLHVWNEIQEEIFPRRFKAIIENTYDNFFVRCDIEAISDYLSFVAKISRFERFIQISAKVYPPNPLFGNLWRSLEEYLRKRNLEELSVKESAAEEGEGIRTELISLMKTLENNESPSLEHPPSLTDAALLMAADGYGSGKVVGVENGAVVVVRTIETKKSFLFDKRPSPKALAQRAWEEFDAINKKRGMRHDDQGGKAIDSDTNN